jgi:ribosomal-protein-alanine N-acetyltransferase
MSKLINCRMAKLEDLDFIFEMEKRIFNQPWTKESIQNELNKSNNTLNIIAEINGKIIGYFFSHIFGKEVHILNLVIDIPFQHKGFGKIFLNRIIKEHLKDVNIFLEVKRTNLPAINLYLSFGFQEINIRKEYYSDGEDAIEMVKKVSNYVLV